MDEIEEFPLYGIPILYSVYYKGLLANKGINSESIYKLLIDTEKYSLKLEITDE